nr:YARHG domain-containing protein [Clostridium sp. MCC344]
MKKICTIVGLCLVLAGCSAATSASKEVVDQVANVVQAEDKHVLMVKNGHPQSYPNCPYGKVFDEFFGSPTWTYFNADSGEDVVEFTGYCTYRDAEVKARLQFILNEEEGTFQSGALSFNDVPQIELVTVSMIEKAFQSYMENHQITDDQSNLENDLEQVFDNETTAETSSVETTEETEKEYSNDNPYKDSILLWKSYFEPLTSEDCIGLSKDQLRIARNEIYAAHGRIFQAEDLRQYFQSKEWYHGTLTSDQFDESVLTDVQKKNLDLIKAIENGNPNYAERGLTIDDPQAIPQAIGLYTYYLDPTDKSSRRMELDIDSDGFISVSFYEGDFQLQRSIDLFNMNDQEYVDSDGEIGIYFDNYGETATYCNTNDDPYSGTYTFCR